MAKESEIEKARANAARALQLVVYEAARSGQPFIARSTAERLVDSLAVLVLEVLAEHATEAEATRAEAHGAYDRG